MGRIGRILGRAALALALAAPPARGLGELGPALVGERFLLRSAGPEAEAREWLAVLEAAWPQYAAFFGAEPKLGRDERLEVQVHETIEALNAALEAEGVGRISAGGIYAFKTRKAYFFRQPSAWYTRALLIHECAHQFHARLEGDKDRPGWYAEGMVEHLAQHAWDGARLQLGIVAPISLEDYPKAALAQLESPGFDFAARLADEAFDRPLGMHLVRLLHRRHAADFRAARRKLDSGRRLDPADWARFGLVDELEAQLRALVAAEQQPFRVGFVDWDARRLEQRDDGPAWSLRGHAPTVVSSAHAARECAWLEFEVAFPEQLGRLGAQLDWIATNDHTVLLAGRDGTTWVQRMTPEGRWTNLLEPRKLPEKDGSSAFGARRLRIERRTDEGGGLLAAVFVDGVEFVAPPVRNSHFGLAFDSGTVDFTGIRHAPLAPPIGADGRPGSGGKGPARR
jgi:hypothetical protein